MKLLTCALLAWATVCLSACTTTPQRTVTWSDAAPVVSPSGSATTEADHGRLAGRQPRTVPASTDTRVGWLRVKTALASLGAYYEGARYREYSIHDPTGRLVYQCGGHTSLDDFVELPAGRYVLVVTTRDWKLDEHSKQVQVVVGPGETTHVDLTRE